MELHELCSEEAAAVMKDLQRASAAVHKVTGAVKMNYEIHGNTIPHLHIHLYPHYKGDPFEGRPIDPRLIRVSPYGVGDYDSLMDMIVAALQASDDGETRPQIGVPQ